MILVLLVAFLLELVAFFSFAALAFTAELHVVLRVVLFLILLSIVIGFWGIYMSPKAPKKLHAGKYYLAKGTIYLVAAFVLAVICNIFIGLLFLVAWIADELLLYVHNRRTNNSKKAKL